MALDPTKVAIGLIGSAVQAVGAISQGRAANQAAKFEAQQLQLQADRDRAIANREAEEFRDNEARRRATLRARSAGSGTTLEGSSLAILSDLAGAAEFEALKIEATGETRATTAENQGAIRRFEGRNARTAGFTRAGATLLTGASKFDLRKALKESTG